MPEYHHTVCRICHAACDLKVHMDNGKVTSIIGNKDNPVYSGYSCIKGRQSDAVMKPPSRLLQSQQRLDNGKFQPIDSEKATADIADRLNRIIETYGPRSVAIFKGTYASLNGCTESMINALARAIGTPMVFDNGTIDQPGKPMSFALHGVWLAGPPTMETWDALLLVGTNPIISMNGGLGVNPARNLKQMQANGMKMVVIDPRVTECARKANIHLQIKPGTDGVALAGVIRQLLANNSIDQPFIDAETHGIDDLRKAVDKFTPDLVAEQCGINADDLISAAKLLGSAPRGAVSAGTGGNMSGQSTLVEFLCRCLSTLRGWWLRAGDNMPNSGVLIEPMPAIAGTMGPTPYTDCGEKMRVRGLTQSAAGLPTAALAEEILKPGEGQIKALLVIGGNPVLAWPDQIRTVKAFENLNLLVTIDPKMTATAEMSHYVLAPKIALECENNTAVYERWKIVGAGWGYETPYVQITSPVIEPPEKADVKEDWQFIFDVAKKMGLQLNVHSHATIDPTRAAELSTMLDMASCPSPTDMWRIALKGSPVPYDQIRQTNKAQILDRPQQKVQAKPEDWTTRLELGAPLVMEMLEELFKETTSHKPENAFPFRLISHRLNDVMNSCGQENPAQKRKWHYNPAFMHPQDLSALAIEDGNVIEISSRRATIMGIAIADETVRPGCIAMSHSWGRHPSKPQRPFVDGANTGRLVANNINYDPITGLPGMSNIPVTVSAASV